VKSYCWNQNRAYRIYRELERPDILACNEGWQEPPQAIFYARNFGVYRVEFFCPQDGHGAGGRGVFLGCQGAS
tara:strand:+ start:1689 stop:1907 length:219 start_codon:yes stop_codon:yes gene_type:complete